MVPNETLVRDRNMKQGEEGPSQVWKTHTSWFPSALPSSLPGWSRVMSGKKFWRPCEMGCPIW